MSRLQQTSVSSLSGRGFPQQPRVDRLEETVRSQKSTIDDLCRKLDIISVAGGSQQQFLTRVDALEATVTSQKSQIDELGRKLNANSVAVKATQEQVNSFQSRMEKAMEAIGQSFSDKMEAQAAASQAKHDSLSAQLASLNSSMALLLQRSTQGPVAPMLPMPPPATPAIRPREANLMIYRLPEAETESASELRATIEAIVTGPCCPLVLENTEPDIIKQIVGKSLVSVQRMGPKSGKPRPTRIIFQDRDQMLQVRRRAWRLKDSAYQGISLDADITPDQQEARRAQRDAIVAALGEGRTTRWNLYDPTKLEISEVKARPEAMSD